MQYDTKGLPLLENGKKRRPNLKYCKCDKCGKETEKIEYGMYGCYNCKLVYKFYKGKWIRGKITVEYRDDISKHMGTNKDKWDFGYSFNIDKNGDYKNYRIDL